MKKSILLVAAAVSLATASAFAQGQIAFSNNGSTLVTTNNGATGSAAVGSSKLALYYQPDPGGAAPAAITSSGVLGSWVLFSPLGNIAPLAGRFNDGTVTTGNEVAPGGLVWLQEVGWTGSATTLAGALATQNVLAGFGNVFSATAGNGGTIPTPLTYNVGMGSLVLTPVPEPSTIALGGLGAAALLLFRRRK